MIYLDNSATTSLAPEVRDAMMPYLMEEYGNASSVYTLGSRARVALEESREVIARSIGAEPREIVFTASGTEANNAALKGPLFKRFLAGTPWRELSLVTSPTEHHAILQPAHFLESLGARVTYVSVDDIGRPLISAEDTAQSYTIASFMLVNNEVGSITPINELATRLREKASTTLIHTDAVQAYGKRPVHVDELAVDMLTLSAHKIHGPKGIGALYVRSGIEWEPLVHGGAQERNRRGGTESVANAVGFAEAVRLFQRDEQAIREHLRSLHQYALSSLRQFPNIVLNSSQDDRCIDSIINFSFAETVVSQLDADALLIRFDMEGIALSNGSACTSGSLQPSHVLVAMGKGDEVARKSIRISFSRYTEHSDIDRLLEALRRIIPQA